MSDLVERLRGLRDQVLAVGEREIAARLDSIAAELARPRAANKAQAAERERCAQIAEHASCSSDKGYAYECGYADARAAIAAAIRGGQP